MGNDPVDYNDPEVKEFLDDVSDYFDEEDRKYLEEEELGRLNEVVRDLNHKI